MIENEARDQIVRDLANAACERIETILQDKGSLLETNGEMVMFASYVALRMLHGPIEMMAVAEFETARPSITKEKAWRKASRMFMSMAVRAMLRAPRPADVEPKTSTSAGSAPG